MPAPTPPSTPSAVPDTPDRTEGQDTFNTKAFAFNDWFAPFQAWLETVLDYIVDAIAWVEDRATAASTSATSAANSATGAANSASTVIQSATTSATVAGSITPAAGSISFTLDQTGKAFSLGQWVAISLSSSPSSKWMLGAISAFNSGTGSITVTVVQFSGSGASSGWTVTASAPIVAVEWGQTEVVTGTSKTVANRGSYLFTNSASQSTATFPPSPASGDRARIDNGTGRTDLTLNPNGKKIMGDTSNLIFNRSGCVEFEYIDESYGWRFR